MQHTSYLDYLRLATWDDNSAMRLNRAMRELFKGWRQTHWLQYSGYGTQHAFYGHGEQNGRRHYVYRVSGPDSQAFFNHIHTILNEKIYATRIDVQVTLPEMETYDPFYTYDIARENSKTQCSLIHSDTGSTIYFGNRESDRFARLYQKEVNAQKFLRLEFEIKGRLSKAIWLQLIKGIEFDTVYSYCLEKTYLPDHIRIPFGNLEAHNELFFNLEMEQNKDRQLEWLISLGNTIVKMGNDHYQGGIVRSYLTRWLELTEEKH